MTTPRTLRDLAVEALAVQDACNLSGVALAFGRAMVDLHAALEAAGDRADTRRVNEHPIAVLWADKIAHLTGTQAIGNERVMGAYRDAYAIRDGAPVVVHVSTQAATDAHAEAAIDARRAEGATEADGRAWAQALRDAGE